MELNLSNCYLILAHNSITGTGLEYLITFNCPRLSLLNLSTNLFIIDHNNIGETGVYYLRMGVWP